MSRRRARPRPAPAGAPVAPRHVPYLALSQNGYGKGLGWGGGGGVEGGFFVFHGCMRRLLNVLPRCSRLPRAAVIKRNRSPHPPLTLRQGLRGPLRSGTSVTWLTSPNHRLGCKGAVLQLGTKSSCFIFRELNSLGLMCMLSRSWNNMRGTLLFCARSWNNIRGTLLFCARNWNNIRGTLLFCARIFFLCPRLGYLFALVCRAVHDYRDASEVPSPSSVCASATKPVHQLKSRPLFKPVVQDVAQIRKFRSPD